MTSHLMYSDLASGPVLYDDKHNQSIAISFQLVTRFGRKRSKEYCLNFKYGSRFVIVQALLATLLDDVEVASEVEVLLQVCVFVRCVVTLMITQISTNAEMQNFKWKYRSTKPPSHSRRLGLNEPSTERRNNGQVAPGWAIRNIIFRRHPRNPRVDCVLVTKTPKPMNKMVVVLLRGTTTNNRESASLVIRPDSQCPSP